MALVRAMRGALGVTATGFTLVEAIVVIAVLGLAVAISGVALASLQPEREDAVVGRLIRARAEAIRTGNRIVVTPNAQRAPRVVFLPDGRALGLGVDPLTGTPR